MTTVKVWPSADGEGKPVCLADLTKSPAPQGRSVAACGERRVSDGVLEIAGGGVCNGEGESLSAAGGHVRDREYRHGPGRGGRAVEVGADGLVSM